jgi:hypothetical protein
MSLLLDKLAAMSSPAMAASPLFLLPELPNMRSFRLLSDAISQIDHVVTKIFENLQQVRMEHNRESIWASRMRIKHAQDDKRILNAQRYNKIFETKRL